MGLVSMSTTDVTTVEARLLAAIVCLLVDARAGTEREAVLKSELLLSNAGLSAAEIAMLLDRQPNAVRMAISRARRGGANDGRE